MHGAPGTLRVQVLSMVPAGQVGALLPLTLDLGIDQPRGELLSVVLPTPIKWRC